MGEIYPAQVEITPKNLDRLIEIFKTAYEDIVKEINTATDFGVANRRAILAQVEEVLQELAKESDTYLADELPKFYSLGADDAIKQLQNIGADIAVKRGFNKVHKEAIGALIDDASRAIAESIRGVGRSANLLLGKAVRDQITQKIATGQIGGAALRQVRQQIKGVLAEQGLTALVDKGGRKWSLEDYAEMVFRTKAVEGRNRGLINRLAENEYDLVQVSEHWTSCDKCKPWQGKILSITGNTKGYQTVAEAELAGLFHPNCRHALNALVPSLAKKTKAYITGTGTYGKAGASF